MDETAIVPGVRRLDDQTRAGSLGDLDVLFLWASMEAESL